MFFKLSYTLRTAKYECFVAYVYDVYDRNTTKYWHKKKKKDYMINKKICYEYYYNKFNFI